jgi:hypothetical protein
MPQHITIVTTRRLLPQKGASMANNKQLQLTLTQGLADALDTYASEHHLNRSEVTRRALAHVLSYDLDNDPAVVRPGRYQTRSIQLEAKRKRDKKRNNQVASIRRLLRDKEAAKIIDGFITS